MKKHIWLQAKVLPTSENENLPLLGSWTVFNRMICSASCLKSTIEYMSAIGEPPNYAVCKNYLDDLKEIAKDLDLDHLFAHADKDLYSKLEHIWKHGNLYKEVIIIMGGFNALRVCQHLIY